MTLMTCPSCGYKHFTYEMCIEYTPTIDVQLGETDPWAADPDRMTRRTA